MKGFNLFSAMMLMSAMSTAALAQDTPTPEPAPATTTKAAKTDDAGFSNDVVKDKENNDNWRSGKSKFPSKPKDMWELGVHGGYLQYAGDVNSQPGYGFGLHVRKSMGYVFSVRLNAMYGVAYGLNYLPSQRGIGKNLQLGVSSKLPTAAASGIVDAPRSNYHGYGYTTPDDRNGNLLTTSTGGFTPIQQNGSGLPFYYNYRSEYAEATVQGIITLNNLKFHKERTKWDLFLIGGAGVQYYNTKHDAMTSDGKLYDFRKIKAVKSTVPGGNIDLFGGRDVQESLKGAGIGVDGADSYETQGEAWGNLENPFLPGNKGKINIVANAGVGVGYKLSKRVTIGLEHQVTFNDDDLLDGYRWTEQGDFTQNKDFPHYTNVRLCFHIGDSKKTVEPLWWLNPLDAPYAAIKKNTEKVDPADMMKDTDGDGVPDMLDREAATPKDCPVDTRGESLDSDGDGVKDCDDKEPYTAPGYPVDPNGVATKLLTNIDCSVCGSKSEWFLPMVNFNTDSYCIKPEFQAQLKHVGTIMSKNSKLCVAVEGYTDDNKGDAGANAALAYNRAKAVADYLSANYGVSADRLKIKIKGEEKIVKGSGVGTTAAAYVNRRVEMRVVECSEASDEAPANAASVGSATNCEPTPGTPQLIYQNTTNPTETIGTKGNNPNSNPNGGGRPHRGGAGKGGIIKR
jgi:outer membrane protein OmpA-like peptidoglycan-associated protein